MIFFFFCNNVVKLTGKYRRTNLMDVKTLKREACVSDRDLPVCA